MNYTEEELMILKLALIDYLRKAEQEFKENKNIDTADMIDKIQKLYDKLAEV